MEKLENKHFSIYNVNEIGLNFENLIKNIELGLTKDNILIWSTMESDLPGGNSWYDFKSFDSLCKKYEIEVNIIFGTIKQKYYDEILNFNNVKIHFWPTYLLNYTFTKFDGYYNGIDILDLKKDLDFKELFVCYNNKPHLHRCKLIDKLYENNLFDCGIISWNKLNEINFNFRYWEENILKIDDLNQDFFHRTNHIIKNSSFLFLVSETTTDCHFITEKTFKAILIEQPFICFGSVKQNIALKNLGFELYDEIFNYDFDYEDDIDKRIDGIISNLNNIKNQNYFELYKKIEHKIKYNKERAITIIRNNLYIPDLIIQNNIPFES